MTEEEGLLTNYPYTCEHCYVNFSGESEDWYLTTGRKKLCEFCSKHPWYIHDHHHTKLARRMIDILDQTSPSDFPKIIKFILNQVKLWGDE